MTGSSIIMGEAPMAEEMRAAARELLAAAKRLAQAGSQPGETQETMDSAGRSMALQAVVRAIGIETGATVDEQLAIATLLGWYIACRAETWDEREQLAMVINGMAFQAVRIADDAAGRGFPTVGEA